jgi:hypothetical protein
MHGPDLYGSDTCRKNPISIAGGHWHVKCFVCLKKLQNIAEQ